MIPDVDGGSTLSRMSSTLHYFNWLHLVFIFKTSKVFADGWHCPEAQAESQNTHTDVCDHHRGRSPPTKLTKP